MFKEVLFNSLLIFYKLQYIWHESNRKSCMCIWYNHQSYDLSEGDIQNHRHWVRVIAARHDLGVVAAQQNAVQIFFYKGGTLCGE